MVQDYKDLMVQDYKWRPKSPKNTSTPTLWLWRVTLLPGKVVPSTSFFYQMTAKDVKEITYM